ncbi:MULTISPECIES: GNAT family N-acetyltransferase [Streptomyces]|uniref:GNAT family N-acetyltransferase n=1 Tax=Streptomyces TaxID=1883 RepID=UPI001E615E7F|nr:MULTISPECIES: GNAT family protein [Streptomyces]UFQ15989.1 GNAT family N-acetyltransferase [Streptomyces huasconensis]WCL85592.1 GNAT family protein [Streptomyces sp. JCM 35825]
MYPVEHTSTRLALREIGIDDVDAVHAIYGDAKATKYLSFEPRTRDQVGQIIARSMVSATAEPRDEYCLAVAERDSGRLIGYARLALDPHQPKGATMGFALRPSAWGVGYGTETVRTVLTLAFDTLGLHRVWAARAPLNTASHKTLLRAGMQEEGRIRQHVFVRGAWRDSITYSIVDDEWKVGQRDLAGERRE